MKVGDIIVMKKSATDRYGVTQAGSTGKIISLRGSSIIEVKFDKLTGDSSVMTESDRKNMTFIVDIKHCEKITRAGMILVNIREQILSSLK